MTTIRKVILSQSLWLWLLALVLCVIVADAVAPGASEPETIPIRQQLAATVRLVGHSRTNASWFQRAVFAVALLLGFGLGGGDAAVATAQAPVDVTQWPGDRCDRPCTGQTVPRLCYYLWTLEHYTAMGS